jgi:hypothetical protein
MTRMKISASALRKISVNLPADYKDRFPDGSYTVGRGADPRGLVLADASRSPKPDQTPRSKAKTRRRKSARTAAE